MTAPTPDVPLLRRAVGWVESEAAKPWEVREWQQQFWRSYHPFCGTVYCVAGYVDHIAGRDTNFDTIADSARQLLGLTGREGKALFAAHNTAADVRRIAEDIAARAGERL